jgi:hypothetical protein
MVCDMASIFNEELLAHRPTPKLEDHTLSAVRDCLFSIVTATLHTGGSHVWKWKGEDTRQILLINNITDGN